MQKVFKLPFCRIAAIRRRQQSNQTPISAECTLVYRHRLVTPSVLAEARIKALKVKSTKRRDVNVFDLFHLAPVGLNHSPPGIHESAISFIFANYFLWPDYS